MYNFYTCGTLLPKVQYMLSILLYIYNCKMFVKGECCAHSCDIVIKTSSLLPGLNSKPFRSLYIEKAYSTVDSDSSVG